MTLDIWEEGKNLKLINSSMLCYMDQYFNVGKDLYYNYRHPILADCNKN